MAGPYQQYSDPELSQPNYSEPYPSDPIPAVPSVYPGMLPPPVEYPKRRRWRLIAVSLVLAMVLAAAAAAIFYAVNTDTAQPGSGQLTEAGAKTAIQNYLNALANGDTETVARNMLCGLYDGVKDKRNDNTLAKLSSDTFRKQYSQAEVTSVDKMVFLAPRQAQVLFSMQVVPVARGGKKQNEQAVATLIAQNDQVLVCQYVLKSAGTY